MTNKKKAAPAGTGTASNTAFHGCNPNPPQVTGQCAQVLRLILLHQPVLSFTLTADHAIPEAAARIHYLRGMGFNIMTTMLTEAAFRGRTRRNVALYSLGTPEWPRPGFFDPDLLADGVIHRSDSEGRGKKGGAQ